MAYWAFVIEHDASAGTALVALEDASGHGWHEESLVGVISDDVLQPDDEVEIEADGDAALIVRTGRRRVRVGEPHKGKVDLTGAGKVELGTIVAGLNTELWKRLSLANRWFIIDEAGALDGVSGIGDVTALAARVAAEREAIEADKAQQHEQAARAAQLADAADNRGSRDRVVNPYSFVPLPDAPGPTRSASTGHDQLAAGNLAGRLHVRWTLVSPLLTQERGPDGARLPRQGDRVVIPGSSIKGAIRSLHETLAGGCLRVVGLDFVPSYREPVETAQGGQGGWTLAVVRGVDGDGRPSEIEVCGETVWIRHDALLAALPEPARETGTRLQVDGWDRVGAAGRNEVLEGGRLRPDPEGQWVLLISDARARRNGKRIDNEWRPGNYYATAGRLGGRVLSGCTDGAWEQYRDAAAGADDLRRARAGDERSRHRAAVDAPDLEVVFRRRENERGPVEEIRIGRRQPVRAALHPGDVMWVKVDHDDVVALRPSLIWRSVGSGAVRQRIPEGWHPCRGTVHDDGLPALCPSCQIFGSADTDAHQEGRSRPADQRSYRGHVRFGTALFAAGAATPTVERAPLSSPRPGAGQFYLEANARTPGEPEKRVPLRQWGSRLDSPAPRPVRGRKFYWHGMGTRHLPDASTNRTLVQQVEVVDTGAEMAATLTFDNLTPAMLGGLIAAIDPARLLSLEHVPDWDPGPIVTHLGGGRPLGFGTVKVIDLDLQVHDAASRYQAAAAPTPTADSLVAAFAESVPAAVRTTWTDLVPMLSASWVDPTQIAYPTTDFFKESAGSRSAMTTLARPAQPDQTLDRSGRSEAER